MKKLCIVLSMVMLLGCGVQPRTFHHDDARKPRVITLSKEPRQKNVARLSIEGGGLVDGNARLMLIVNDETRKIEEVTGSYWFSGDEACRSDTAMVVYEPDDDAQGGYLRFNYVFTR